MTNQKVSNEQLYEFLHEFKTDFVNFKNEVNSRFTRLERNMERLERNVERLEDNLKSLEDTVKQMDTRLQKVETKIDNIHISWNHKLVVGTIGTSAVISGLIAFFISSIY